MKRDPCPECGGRLPQDAWGHKPGCKRHQEELGRRLEGRPYPEAEQDRDEKELRR